LNIVSVSKSLAWHSPRSLGDAPEASPSLWFELGGTTSQSLVDVSGDVDHDSLGGEALQPHFEDLAESRPSSWFELGGAASQSLVVYSSDANAATRGERRRK
jgi:hypothetical protein